MVCFPTTYVVEHFTDGSVAEDNPANDYPDDETNSEDELGLGVRTHAQTDSDSNDDHDLKDSWSHSE